MPICLLGQPPELSSSDWEKRPHLPDEPAIWGRLAFVDAGDGRERRAALPLAQERSRLFDEQAEAYDRFRPSYPDAVIDELLGPVPAGLDVLDVGCGTGIASRQMAQRGATVLGVELAPRMAEIARSHGIDVELGAFEGWDAAGRTFDRVTSAQAWHWLDLPIATAKAASVLRQGAGLVWSGTPRVSLMIWPMLSRMGTRVPWCPTSARRQRSGFHGRGHTRGMSGWTTLSHGATMPPSNRRTDGVEFRAEPGLQVG